MPEPGLEWRRAVVGFVDVMGAKAKCDDLAFLASLRWFTARYRTVLSRWPLGAQGGARVHLFSDNIGIYVPLNLQDDSSKETSELVHELFKLTSGFQYQLLLRHTLLCRGGFSIGGAYCDQEMIFGPALVEAVQLEGAANVPRLALSAQVEAIAARAGVPLTQEESLRKPYEGRSARAIDFFSAEARAEEDSQVRARLADGLALARASLDSAPDEASAGVARHVIELWTWTESLFNQTVGNRA